MSPAALHTALSQVFAQGIAVGLFVGLFAGLSLPWVATLAERRRAPVPPCLWEESSQSPTSA